MEDWAISLPATGITAVSLIVLLYVGQVRGLWYPGRMVDRLTTEWQKRVTEARDDRDARVAEVRADCAARLKDMTDERDVYRAALEVAQETLRMQTEQMHDLVDANRTTHAALQSIARAGAEHAVDATGGSHD